VQNPANPVPPRWRSHYSTLEPVAGGMLVQCDVVWESKTKQDTPAVNLLWGGNNMLDSFRIGAILTIIHSLPWRL
jgi:hypothetical protein